MASFNKVILVGNLTRDPELRHIPSGSAVTELGLAVNRSWYDKNTNSRREEVTFIDVTLWGRTAEVAAQYLSKGRPVLIEGYLKMDEWEDRDTGKKRTKLKVVGDNMTMLGSAGDGGGSGGGNYQNRGGSSQQSSAQSAPSQSSGNDPATSFYDEAGDDDVPF